MKTELSRKHDTELRGTMYEQSAGEFRLALERLTKALHETKDVGLVRGLAILAVDTARAWSRGVDHDLLASGINNVLDIPESDIAPGKAYRLEADCSKCNAPRSMHYVRATDIYACSECPHSVPAAEFVAAARRYFAALKGGGAS